MNYFHFHTIIRYIRNNYYYKDNFDKNLLSLIKINFNNLGKKKSENSLKKCIAEKLSCLEVLNVLHSENQILNHLKYFKISSKINKYFLRDYSKYNISEFNCEQRHFEIIQKYKISPIHNDLDDQINYTDNTDKRRELKADTKCKIVIKF